MGTTSVLHFPASVDTAKRLHAARMFAWLDAITADIELCRRHPRAVAVAEVLRRRMHQNGTTGTIDRAYIAGQIGVSVPTVQRTLTALVAAGHLQRTPGRGRAGCRYIALGIDHGRSINGSQVTREMDHGRSIRNHSKSLLSMSGATLIRGAEVVMPGTAPAERLLASGLLSPFLAAQLRDGRPITVSRNADPLLTRSGEISTLLSKSADCHEQIHSGPTPDGRGKPA